MIFGKAIGITAGVVVRKMGADAWTSMAIGFVMGTLLMLLMVYICSRFPNKTVLEFSEILLGKYISKLLGIILALYFIMSFGASANVMTMHLKEYFLTSTPFLVLCILYIILCMYGTFLGIEVVARFALVGFIMSLLINLAMVTGTLEDVRPINLFPLMDMGLIQNIKGSMYVFGDISMAVLAVGFLYPLLNNKKSSFKITFWAMLSGTMMVIIWPMFETMVLGPGLMKQYVVVCMQQIRCAQLTKYLPRYELIMVSFFTFGVFVQSVCMFYCASYCIKQVTKIKTNWIIILPLTLILLPVTYFITCNIFYGR